VFWFSTFFFRTVLSFHERVRGWCSEHVIGYSSPLLALKRFLGDGTLDILHVVRQTSLLYYPFQNCSLALETILVAARILGIRACTHGLPDSFRIR